MKRGFLSVIFLLAVVSALFAAPERIACVGDSITQGIGTPQASDKTFPASYPSQLQVLLGDKAEVMNFGVGGRTLLRKADALAMGRAMASKPDRVVIMLGTNDSKPYAYGKHGAEFVPDYVKIVKDFQSLPSKPVVYVVLPPPVFKGGQWGITEQVIFRDIMPAIREVAKQTGAKLIDAHTPFAADMALFPDRVHPNPEGAKKLAAVIAAGLEGKVWNPPSGRKIRVVCAGDSITQGIGTAQAADKSFPDSYPAQLGQLLGAGYEVMNFGVGGRTLIRKADAFGYGRAMQAAPDIAVICLGTNDSKPYCWDSRKADFIPDYGKMVEDFQSQPSHPRIILCLPPPAFKGGQWGIREEVLEKELRPAVREVAQKLGCEVLDLATPLRSDEALFPDRIHPNKAGAAKIAALVAERVREPR